MNKKRGNVYNRIITKKKTEYVQILYLKYGGTCYIIKVNIAMTTLLLGRVYHAENWLR